jgi:hypothetical protein
MAELPYRGVVGSLLFAAISTRPDIAKVVSDLTRFLCNPGRPHWRAALHVLLYLRGTAHLGIRFTASGRRDLSCLRLQALVDTSFAPLWKENDCRSVTGFFLRLAHGPLYWETHRQPTEAKSTGESEFVALTSCCETIVWVVYFLVRIGILQSAVALYEDNTTAISMASRPLLSRKTKHITVKVEWLRRMVATGEVVIFVCPTEHQIADMLTKCQGRVLFLSQRGQALGYVLWVPPSSTLDVHRFDNADGITDDGGAEEEKS